MNIDPNFIPIEKIVKVRMEWNHVVERADVKEPYIVMVECFS